MGFLSSLVAYLTVVAAFSGMTLATFFYLTSPPDPGRTGDEAKQSAQASTAAIEQANPARGRTGVAGRKTAATQAKAPAATPSKSTLPAIAAPSEATASPPTNASLAPADRTTGRGPSLSERRLSQSEPNAETPAAPPPKKVKKRAKKQPTVAKRAPPPRPSFDQWNGRFAGPAERPYYYERSPFRSDRGPYPYERGPFWYR